MRNPAVAVTRDQYDTLWRDLWANTHAGGPMARTRYRLALHWLQLSAGSHERVLDVGAGNGAFLAQALRAAPGLQIFGAEFSQAAIDLAHPSIRDRLANCDLQSSRPLPWGGAFQIVTCMEVLEHLPDDRLAIRHLAQALAPQGRLLVSVPAWESQWGVQDVTAGHVRRYEPRILRERLEDAGLVVERTRCWGGPMTWAYLRATDLLGPRRTMSLRPVGIAGMLAEGVYQLLRLDDILSFGRGPQLLVMARRAADRR